MKSDKPTVVLIHGMLASASIWDDVAQHLAASFDVVVPSLLGHDRSKKSNGPYTLQSVADKFTTDLALMDATNCILVGWSFGASVAMRYVADGGSAVGLVLIGASPQFVRDAIYPYGMPREGAALRDKALAQHYAATLAQFGEQVANGKGAAATLVSDLAKKVPRDITLDLFKHSWTDSLIDDLDKIRLPARIIHGDKDRICDRRSAIFLEEHLPQGGPVQWVKGGSHVPFLTHRDEFLKALQTALEGIVGWSAPEKVVRSLS